MFTVLLWSSLLVLRVCVCVCETVDQGSLEKEPNYIFVHLNHGVVWLSDIIFIIAFLLFAMELFQNMLK